MILTKVFAIRTHLRRKDASHFGNNENASPRRHIFKKLLEKKEKEKHTVYMPFWMLSVVGNQPAQ